MNKHIVFICKDKMVEVDRDLWRSLVSTPLLRQGHLVQVAQNVQMAFEYLQWWRLHNLIAEGCALVLRMIKSSSKFRGSLLCFSLFLLPLVMSLSTTKKSLALFSLQHLFRYLYTLMWCHWASFWGWNTNSLSFPKLSLEVCESPSVALDYASSSISCLWSGAQIWTQHLSSRGKSSFPLTSWQPRISFTFFSARPHCWFVLNLSTGVQQCLSTALSEFGFPMYFFLKSSEDLLICNFSLGKKKICS